MLEEDDHLNVEAAPPPHAPGEDRDDVDKAMILLVMTCLAFSMVAPDGVVGVEDVGRKEGQHGEHCLQHGQTLEVGASSPGLRQK